MATTFGTETTADEVLQSIDLSGKHILVTGVSSGIGLETARVLAAQGATVIGAARNLDKARKHTEGLSGLELIDIDLTSLASVCKAADDMVAADQPLDLIVANAGVMATPFGHTADGFEMQFGTNHLGHFALVTRLLPLLRAGSRLVSLTSGGHRAGDVDLDDPGFERTPYNPMNAYGRSKTANVLFAVEFDRRYRERGIRAAAVHPGTIDTELNRHQSAETMARMIAAINDNRPAGAPEFRFKTVGQGAATPVWAGIVAAADEIGGRYCENCHVAEVNDTPGSRVGVRSYALDPARSRALWTLSEAMIAKQA